MRLGLKHLQKEKLKPQEEFIIKLIPNSEVHP